MGSATVLAQRIANLGTENAFAVSLAAADWSARGNRVFPFHLGDLNFETPSNVAEALSKAVAEGKTTYCPGAGILPLREALAENVGALRGMNFSPDQVVIQPGGKPVITKFIQAMVNPGEEVLYPTPGFPIYESQIEYYGCTPKPYRYVPTDTGFAVDIDFLRAQITPNTRALIVNDLHNPLGTEATPQERAAIAELAIENNLIVLSDEAYFETRYSGASESIAALPGMAERTIILYTFSKKYAMTGWRLGAAITPPEIAPVFSRLNTNDESCTAHMVQYAGVAALTGPQESVTRMMDELRVRRDAAVDGLLTIPGVSVARPESTFYLFPDVTDTMKAMGIDDLAVFAEKALHNTGMSFCTRRHFGRQQVWETRNYIRLAYSGINATDIAEGLEGMRAWIVSEIEDRASR